MNKILESILIKYPDNSNPQHRLMKEIFLLRRSAVDYISQADDIINRNLSVIADFYKSIGIEEVIFVSELDRAIITRIRCGDKGNELSFSANKDDIEPGFIGVKYKS